MNNLSDWLHAELVTYCHWVELGDKPLAIIQLQQRYHEAVIKYLNNYQPHIKYVINFCTDGWLTLILYKYDHMRIIYDYLPDEPNSIFDHWLIGKACGYSDKAIEQYLHKNNYI